MMLGCGVLLILLLLLLLPLLLLSLLLPLLRLLLLCHVPGHHECRNSPFCCCCCRIRYQGSWKGGQRHGQGLMVFADGVVFRGLWEEDSWVQSAADPVLCRLRGHGLSRAVAGKSAEFVIKVS
jgi:hypothetical protein